MRCNLVCGICAIFEDRIVDAGQPARLDAVMQVASAAQEIMVTATDVHGDAEAINRIDSSENILNVITNDQIMSLPNADVADALGRMLGVTLERDEGEGKYVQIRGTEPRLSNTTIDGVLAPSPESTVNQIKLDTIPADLVESVEINKTLSANQDGDAIGGSVNLVTKTAGDRADDYRICQRGLYADHRWPSCQPVRHYRWQALLWEEAGRSGQLHLRLQRAGHRRH